MTATVGQATLAERAHRIRRTVIRMCAGRGQGYAGQGLALADLMAALYFHELREHDHFVLSTGHSAIAVFAALHERGLYELAELETYGMDGSQIEESPLEGTPGFEITGGSLGQGVSQAVGMALGERIKGTDSRVYCIVSDGELQEGQVWESLGSAANRRMGEITAIVDRNKLQSDTWVDQVSDLGDLQAKAVAWGWACGRCDGHDLRALDAALTSLHREAPETPRLLIADTVKGAGVSFMEPRELEHTPRALYGFHSGAPSEEQYEAAVAELEGRLNRRLEALDAAPAGLEPDGDRWGAVEGRPAMSGAPAPGGGAPPGDEGAAAQVAPIPATPGEAQRLIPAYAAALEEMGEDEPRLVVLDADLVLDCGLIPFRDRFPERFIECGIAEQDMVSQAGTLALSGLLPAVHSFACFLTPRANEQIYNNATEGTKVIYTGSLVGLVPAGPGHSHQSVRDIAAMGAMPGMSLIEPFSEAECGAALRWAVQDAEGPVYIRLVSVPWPLPFDPGPAPHLVPGRGTVLREGPDALVVATGPVMVSSAWLAADELERQGAAGCTVVALPWLRGIDGPWLAELAGDRPILCLDNHYPVGGQGDAVTAALAAAGLPAAGRVRRLAVETVPACGANHEVLRAHRLDPAGVAEAVRAAVGEPA